MIDNNNSIEVRDVTKKFKVYLDKGSQLKERLLFRSRNRYEERRVLDGISFNVKKGEAIGLIGHNGCGKSTTLKLLTRIMYPDSGTIEMKGRVSSLIELGAGFHPDMSGRENIYTNAAIFGLTKKEIDARMDDIIDFSEMAPFLDNPVRTYSSGMYMRLAFSVAINVNADILLIDEILAVGDVNFQAKCFNKLREIKAQGTTIVIVSHSMGQIEQICDRSIWIHEGKIRMEGKPRDVDPAYLDFMGQQRQDIASAQEAQRREKEAQKDAEAAKKANANHSDGKNPGASGDASAEDAQSLSPEEAAKKAAEERARAKQEEEAKKRWGNGRARFASVFLQNAKGEKKTVFATGEPMKICMDYRVKAKVEDAVVGIGIFRSDGLQCYGTNTRIEQFDRFDLSQDGHAYITVDPMNLLPGQYTLDVAIESDDATPVDYYKEACRFEVFSSIGDVGVARLAHTWEMK